MSSGRGRVGLLAGSLLTAACVEPSHTTNGQWVGDIRHPGGAERMEVSIDSGGRSARVSVPGWQLDQTFPSSTPAGSDSLAFTAVIDGDTTHFRGTVHGSAWSGEAVRGTKSSRFVLRRLHSLPTASGGPSSGRTVPTTAVSSASPRSPNSGAPPCS